MGLVQLGVSPIGVSPIGVSPNDISPIRVSPNGGGPILGVFTAEQSNLSAVKISSLH